MDTVDTIPGGDSYASLVSDDEGNAYVVLWTTGRYPRVYYSSDTGKTWVLKGEVVAAGQGAGEPSVAIQMDWQYLYVAVWDEGIVPRLYASSDGGTSWNYVADISDLTGNVSGYEDVLDITNDNGGHLMAFVWKEYGTDYYAPRFYLSGDQGQTWQLLYNFPEGSNYDDPAGAILFWPRTGELFVLMWADGEDLSVAKLYSSSDTGRTWSVKAEITPPYSGSDMNNFVSLTATPQGNLYAAFWNDKNNNPVYVYRSEDGGNTWQAAGTIPRNTNSIDSYRPTVDLMAYVNPVLKVRENSERTLWVRAGLGWLELRGEGEVRVRAYDAAGRLVSKLFEGELRGSVRLPVPKGARFAVVEQEGRIEAVKLLP